VPLCPIPHRQSEVAGAGGGLLGQTPPGVLVAGEGVESQWLVAGVDQGSRGVRGGQPFGGRGQVGVVVDEHRGLTAQFERDRTQVLGGGRATMRPTVALPV
jgi:hypothetical protein